MVLARPDYTQEFIVDFDSSNEEVGAILSQELSSEEGMKERPIYLFSKTLNVSPRNY